VNKKKQKNFVNLVACAPDRASTRETNRIKVFCFFFSKKKILLSL